MYVIIFVLYIIIIGAAMKIGLEICNEKQIEFMVVPKNTLAKGQYNQLEAHPFKFKIILEQFKYLEIIINRNNEIQAEIKSKKFKKAEINATLY